MNTKLPRDVLFHRDLQLMIWRPHGVLNEKIVNQLISFIGDQEAASNTPFNRLLETRHIEAVELNFRYMFHVALFRRLSHGGRPPIKCAFLLSSLAKAHYSKLFQVLMEGSSIKVRLFEERGPAAKWLGVPIETLED